jgi:putative DNA primase/helicase
VAVAAMVALGSVIGRQVAIRPQDKTDWAEFANLWGMIIGRPSTMKSPAMEQALGPLHRLEANSTKNHQAEMQEWEARSRLAKLQRDEGEKTARKKITANDFSAAREALDVPEPEQPTPKRYIANDTSCESLGELHRGNPNGLLVFRDELVSLLKGLDREDNQTARAFYLTGAGGKQGYTFDRITRKGASLEAVCLSLLGSTQPGKIAEYVRTAVKGGDGDDGLLQRFGMMVWPDQSCEWRNVDRWPDTEARKLAFEVFARLDCINPEAIGAEQDRDYNGEPDGRPFLRLDAEARGVFSEWREQLQMRLRGGKEDAALESHFGKYPKLIPALALILHLAGDGRGPVSGQAMLQALAWGEYLESHARRVYGSLANAENAAAKAIVTKIRAGDLTRQFGAREVYRHGWANLSDRDTVRSALELLCDLDWLRRIELDDTGGRFATLYQANAGEFGE